MTYQGDIFRISTFCFQLPSVCLWSACSHHLPPGQESWFLPNSSKICVRLLVYVSLEEEPGLCFIAELLFKLGFPGDSAVKNPLGTGTFPGEGNGNPFQYSCLGNPTDGLAHGVAKESDTTERLNNNSKVQGSICGTIRTAAMSLSTA